MSSTPTPPDNDTPPAEPKPSAETEPTPLTGVELIKAHLKNLPESPGVYRMIDTAGEVLYVGKARRLKSRVSSYAKLSGHTNRIARMILSTADMVFITTSTETEALLLEANLIKRLKPRFNVLMRDDKSLPYILVRQDHDFAQVLKYRGARTTKGKYFGPFASPGAVNRTLNTLQRAFLLRSCTDNVFDNRSRPCLLYQIKRCSAPCVGYIDKHDYDDLVDQTVNFLSGRSTHIQAQLSRAMEDASANLEFERAALYRDRIRALTTVQARQGINPTHTEEADVFAAHAEGGQVCIQVFFFRARQNWGNRAYFPRHDKAATEAEVLEAFLAQFYDNKPVPKLVLLSHDIDNKDLLSEALTTKSNHKVEIAVPKRGERKDMVTHAHTNAREALGRRLADVSSQQKLLAGVAETFGLDTPPNRIEVYDNSHISGTNAVGGMIVAGPEGFVKNQYRKFNIKDEDFTPGDDYAMMREVLTRRFARLLKEPKPKAPDNTNDADTADDGAPRETSKETPWPDLILIDGGPGQLSSALEVADTLGLSDLTIVGIAKGPERDAGREHFYMKDRAPFMLDPKSPVLYYLQRLRDEAHRFAIGSHRARRKSDIGANALDDVPGIGAKRKRALLNHFGSARSVKRAGLSDLEAVDGISKATAKRIYDFFHSDV